MVSEYNETEGDNVTSSTQSDLADIIEESGKKRRYCQFFTREFRGLHLLFELRMNCSPVCLSNVCGPGAPQEAVG